MTSHATYSVRLGYGDWVDFEDERHKVTGIVGPCVRLRSETGKSQLIGLAELTSDPSFQAANAPHASASELDAARLDPSTVLSDLPETEQNRAVELEAHLLEVTTGYRSGDPDNPAPGEPRAAYQPRRSQYERVEAKAAELGLTGRRVRQLLDAWHAQGLWALVDKRKAKARSPLAQADVVAPGTTPALHTDQYRVTRHLGADQDVDLAALPGNPVGEAR